MLGLKFSRLVHASLAGGSLMLAGCVDRAYDFGDSGSFDPNDPDDPDDPDPDDPDPDDPDPNTQPPPPPPPPDVPGPPQLIDVQFADNLTLALTFTEAIAPPTNVDPTQFRLSAAFAPQNPDYEYSYGTFYQEPGLWNGVDYFCEENCYEYCYQDECYERCWEYCYTPPGPPVRVATLTPLADRPEVLLLTLDNGIGGGVCGQLNQFPEPWLSALFIHYTAQGPAAIADYVGEPLAPIADHWALDPGREYNYVDGFFPFMQPLLPIPCPF